jgi:hypothetical protein
MVQVARIAIHPVLTAVLTLAPMAPNLRGQQQDSDP